MWKDEFGLGTFDRPINRLTKKQQQALKQQALEREQQQQEQEQSDDGDGTYGYPASFFEHQGELNIDQKKFVVNHYPDYINKPTEILSELYETA